MLDEKIIEMELRKREKITFSEFRRDFKLTYLEAKEEIERLIEADLLKYASGMTYFVRKSGRNPEKEKKRAEKDTEQADFFDQLIRGMKTTDKPEVVFRPNRKTDDEDESALRKSIIDEVRKISDELALESLKKMNAKKEDKDGGKPKKQGKMGEGKKKPRQEFDIEERAMPKSDFPPDFLSMPTEYQLWKRSHKADEKDFPDDKMQLTHILHSNLDSGIVPNSYKKITVIGYDGEKIPIELTMREDRKVMWLSINGCVKADGNLPITQIRNKIKRYSGVKCMKNSLFITMTKPEQTIGAMINLCGAYAALNRADE